MTADVRGDCWTRIGVSGDRSCPDLARHVHCRNCPAYARGALRLFDRPPPAGYLEEWKGVLAGPREPDAAFSDTVLVFRVGPEWLGLPAPVCLEVVGQRTVRPVPHRSGPVFIGVASVRGELLLCASLAALLEIPPAPGDAAPGTPRLVVARHARSTWLFPADAVEGLLRFEAREVLPLPATVAHAVPRYSRGLLARGSRRIGLLDAARVFQALDERVVP